VQVIFRKRATNYRALLRNMTLKHSVFNDLRVGSTRVSCGVSGNNDLGVYDLRIVRDMRVNSDFGVNSHVKIISVLRVIGEYIVIGESSVI